MQHDRRRRGSDIPNASFAEVINAYLASDVFAALASGTRYNYSHYLGWAQRREALGSLSIHVLGPDHVQAWLDGLSAKPGCQAMAKGALLALQKWACVRRRLPFPIMIGVQASAYTDEDGHDPWPDSLIELAISSSRRPELTRALKLLAATGQRRSDIIKMRFNDIERILYSVTGEWMSGINVTQKKTGKKLWVPIDDAFAAEIASWPRTMPPFLVLNVHGQPMTGRWLSRLFHREREGNPAWAPIKEQGLVIHGLRAARVVALRKRGLTDLQIASIVGMSRPMVERYTRLAAQEQMAMAAVHYLNKTADTKKPHFNHG